MDRKSSGNGVLEWLCRCCGRAVVNLRNSRWSEATRHDPRSYTSVYRKTWDGNPYFVPSIHHRHPPKRFYSRMGTAEDPFAH